jgi:hypothetical protein
MLEHALYNSGGHTQEAQCAGASKFCSLTGFNKANRSRKGRVRREELWRACLWRLVSEGLLITSWMSPQAHQTVPQLSASTGCGKEGVCVFALAPQRNRAVGSNPHRPEHTIVEAEIQQPRRQSQRSCKFQVMSSD